MIDISREELTKIITKIVVEKISEHNDKIPVGVSNRHIHLSEEDLSTLFGKGSSLTKLKALKQPGQFACKEIVTIKGPKGQLEKVRILGPTRPETQVEISVSDSFKLGVKPVIAESGKLDNTPAIEIIGPCGTVKKDRGALVALRHIHMPEDTAEKHNLKDKDFVSVEVNGIRSCRLDNVLVRVSDKFLPEMHVDTDEANSALLNNQSFVKIVK